MNTDLVSVFAVMALGWLAFRLYHDWCFLTRRRVSALATVVKHDVISGEGGETPLLVVRFETDDGQTVDVRDSLGRWSRQLDVGSLIGVEYPAGYPKMARLLQSRPVAMDYVVCLVILAIWVAFMIDPKWMERFR